MTQRDEPAENPADVEPGEQLIVTAPDASSSPKDFLLWAGVILLAVLTVYSPAMHGKFLWDDDRHVAQNRNLRDAEGLANIWSKFGCATAGRRSITRSRTRRTGSSISSSAPRQATSTRRSST